jgi:hypothetical protein
MKIGKTGITVVAVVCLFVSSAGWKSVEANCRKGEEGMTGSKVAAVLERHREELMALPGVAGVGEGRCNGKPCIKVYVKGKETGGKIPAEIEGFPVSVEETGEFRTK